MKLAIIFDKQGNPLPICEALFFFFFMDVRNETNKRTSFCGAALFLLVKKKEKQTE